MIKVITTFITLLFCSTQFAQSSFSDEEKQHLNIIFLDENKVPIKQTILLESKSDNIILELKSDENGVIDTLIPTNNTYVIHLINKINDEKTKTEIKPIKRHEELLGILGLILNFAVKEKKK